LYKQRAQIPKKSPFRELKKRIIVEVEKLHLSLHTLFSHISAEIEILLMLSLSLAV